MQRKGCAKISNPTTWKRLLHKSSHQWAIHRSSNRPASISNYPTDKRTMSTPLLCSLIRTIRGNHTNNTPVRIQTLNFKIFPPLTFTGNLIRLPCTKVHRNPNSSTLVSSAYVILHMLTSCDHVKHLHMNHHNLPNQIPPSNFTGKLIRWPCRKVHKNPSSSRPVRSAFILIEGRYVNASNTWITMVSPSSWVMKHCQRTCRKWAISLPILITTQRLP